MIDKLFRGFTPPVWMRHFISYRLLDWLNDHSSVCWANVVMWREHGDSDSWWPTSCWQKDLVDHGDWCGKFKTEAEHDKAMQGNTEETYSFIEPKERV